MGDYFPPLFMNTEISQVLWKLFEKLDNQIIQSRQVKVYLAGGFAVQLYTGDRYTEGVDAHFDTRIFIPKDLIVHSTLTSGQDLTGYFNTNFNLGNVLLHPKALASAVFLEKRFCSLFPYVLSPLDLALSKIERFSTLDQSDIEALLKLKFFTVKELEHRALEALDQYCGNTTQLRDRVDRAILKLSTSST